MGPKVVGLILGPIAMQCGHMQKGLLVLQVTSGGLAPNTLSQSHTSDQQNGVAVPKANALVSISETDVTQAGKQSLVSIIRICTTTG